jgi:SAM-dependent methyltransferase
MDQAANGLGGHLSATASAESGRLPEQLGRLYANRFPEPERKAKAELWRTLCDHFFARYVAPGATVLDAGAGYCDLINHLNAGRRIAIDLNPDMPRFAAAGVETHLLPLERLGAAVAPASVDVAFASNVFEHLRGPAALLEVLGEIFRALRPGGRLVVMQPNVRLVGGRFWDFFDHTLPLTEKGMQEALGVAGFRVVECRARFLPYTTKGRLPMWPWLVRLYLALPLAHWVFGKQMLVVAEKPQA